jgi:GTP cyclohydrolase I
MTEDFMQSELTAQAASVLFHAAGLDVTNPHGAATPARFVRMLQELTTPEPFKFTTFPAESQNMIMLKDIPFSSVCSHHVIPFVGYAHVAYVPNKLIAGLSKFARLIKASSRSLQVQESLTMQIADGIEHHLEPLGVAVIMEAEHLCMTIRGAQSPGTKTRTAEMRGVFADHAKTAKTEFLSYVNGGK